MKKSEDFQLGGALEAEKSFIFPMKKKLNPRKGYVWGKIGVVVFNRHRGSFKGKKSKGRA